MADWKNVAIADLERQIAELRAELDAAKADLEFLYALDVACGSVRDGMEFTRLCRERAESAESSVSALSAEVERLRMDNETLGRALFWFAQYPEYKPNPDMMAEWLSDLAAAKPLIPPRASLNGGSDHG